MNLVVDALTALLLVSGALFSLSASIGLLRFPDSLARLQASSKAQSLGLVLILVGAAVRTPAPYTGPLLLIAVFHLITSPVTAQIIGRVAYRTDAIDGERLAVDQLAGTPAAGRRRDRARRDG